MGSNASRLCPNSQRKILIAVVGTTGVGKSKLALELAQAIGGQLINADSMQVYKGLDIATNKPTAAEQALVPHHLLSFVDPAREYSVSEFSKDALNTIASLHSKCQVPIIVGGTNYYIQSLLWDANMIPTAPTPGISSTSHTLRDLVHPSVAAMPELEAELIAALEKSDPRLAQPSDIAAFAETPTLYDLLQRVDPVMANRWHPRDARKIRRSLEIYFTTGKQHSRWMQEQSEQRAQHQTQLRYPTIVFWLYSQPSELYQRLDSRVDEMINSGLLNELGEMRAKMHSGQVVGLLSSLNMNESQSNTVEDSDSESISERSSLDRAAPDSIYTRGILQAIGFKEFHSYLNAIEAHQQLSNAQIDELLAKGIDEMKRATRQYARRQVTWIKNKLAPACLREHNAGHGAFYLLDATKLDDWDSRIRDKAIELAISFIASSAGTPVNIDPTSTSDLAREMLQPLMVSTVAAQPSNHIVFESGANQSLDQSTRRTPTAAELWQKQTCTVCVDRQTGRPRVFNGKHEWEVHLKTKGHRANTSKASRERHAAVDPSRRISREPPQNESDPGN